MVAATHLHLHLQTATMMMTTMTVAFLKGRSLFALVTSSRTLFTSMRSI